VHRANGLEAVLARRKTLCLEPALLALITMKVRRRSSCFNFTMAPATG